MGPHLHLRVVRHVRYRLLRLRPHDDRNHGPKEPSRMPRVVKGGLIQSHNAAPIDVPVDQIKKLNIEHQMKFVEQAGKQGVQILCLQEVFATPYFCAEQQPKWYDATEKVPDGPTVRMMQEVAKK